VNEREKSTVSEKCLKVALDLMVVVRKSCKWWQEMVVAGREESRLSRRPSLSQLYTYTVQAAADSVAHLPVSYRIHSHSSTFRQEIGQA
jgi:hypothetical protein